MLELVKKFVYDIPPTMRNWTQVILIATFALSVFPQGVPTPVGTMCISSFAMLVGLVWIINKRATQNKSLVPTIVLKHAVVIACAAYFLLGLATFPNCDMPMYWVKEVVQRTIIIWLPTLVFTLVPQKPKDIQKAILAYLPLCSIIAVATFWDARHSHFATPSYAFGMHKNHIAGSCSVMGTIAIAAMLTSKNVHKRLLMIGFLGLAIIGCFASQGKAGLLCMVVATLFMMFASGVKMKRILYFGLAIVVSAGLMWKFMPHEAREHVVSTKKFSTNEIRMTLWTDILPVLTKEPFIAVGWGQLLLKDGRYFGDGACVLLLDWFQMTILGPILLLISIFFAVKLPLDNAKRIPKNTALAFINLVALGVICGRFFHAMVDSFWIGRGVTLCTWAAIGMALFVKLYLDQKQKRLLSVSLSRANESTIALK
ncbi:MAG TPA: hypothetical protein V6C76_14580 [Drouetiella sp.]